MVVVRDRSSLKDRSSQPRLPLHACGSLEERDSLDSLEDRSPRPRLLVDAPHHGLELPPRASLDVFADEEGVLDRDFHRLLPLDGFDDLPLEPVSYTHLTLPTILLV